MRTASMVTVLLLLLMTAAPLANGTPPTGGDATAIDQDETWTEDASMDGHIVVSNGATLTVNANITMAAGSSIVVEQNSQLVVTNGALASEELNAGLRVEANPFADAILTLNFGDLADEGVVQLKLDHEIGSEGRVEITYANTTVNASGSDLVQFDAPLDGTDIVVTFDTAYLTPTYVLWAKAIHSGGDTATLKAEEISAVEAPLYWFQSGFDLRVHGDLSVTTSILSGAAIQCDGLCSFNGADLVGSAPINASSTASVNVQNSVISGSRTDEDIVLHDSAAITYTNSQGTGGTTDAWVRILSQRTLSTNIPNGSLDIYDIGYNANDWNDLTDANGEIVLVGPGETNEMKRMVAWMDGNGVVHQEDATITLSITSSWGTFSKTIDAPTTSTGTLQLDLPFISVTAVSPETTVGVANKSVSGTVTVENTGNTTASSVNLWCYEGEDIADTTQMVVSLEAGEEKEVPFTWYGYAAGEITLTCKPLLPTALEGIAGAVHDDVGATSEPVTWSYEEEVGEFPLIILIVVLLGFGGLAMYISAQSKKNRDDFNKPADRVPVIEDEEKTDAPSEGGSIYDLQIEDETV